MKWGQVWVFERCEEEGGKETENRRERKREHAFKVPGKFFLLETNPLFANKK